VKILYFGGQKSGKSFLAEQKALKLSPSKKPFYVATYDNSFNDESMIKRVQNHKFQREDRFITLEESKNLSKIIKSSNLYLIDCLSMWILNTINWDIKELFTELEKLSKKDSDIIFVLNSVGSGVIPIDEISREYVDRVGLIGQKVVSFCDEVYEAKFGLEVKLK
jgi:adenosylcobinamide kinase/adenosylcobinamide-phosphate guanylyltransferase